MLQVSEKAYQLDVVTYKICKILTNCYRLVLRLKFIMTVKLLYDQAESDFVQCQTKLRAFASRICSEFKQIELNWNRIVHQNASRSLFFSTQTNLRAGCKSAHQPGTMTGRRSETFHPTFDIWYLFSSEDKYKVFSLHQREDWLIDLNYSSVNFKWTEDFLCCQSFDRRGQWIFLKNTGHTGQV